MSDHYTKKLADLVGSSHQEMKSYIATYFKTQSSKKHDQGIPVSTKISIISNPREEYCLALLLQHPELKTLSTSIKPEYFENSENHEIFNAYLINDSILSIKDKIDSTIWEHLNDLMTRKFPPNNVDKKLADCIQRLKEEHNRNLERKKEAVLASEAALGGSKAELNKLKEQGIEPSVELRDIFIMRSRDSQKQRRNS
jgi:hypothetical protein